MIFVLMRRELVLRRKTQDKLFESEEKYRTLIEVSQDAIFIYQHDRVTYLNPACVRLLGAKNPEEIIGKTAFDIFHPDFHDGIRTRIKAMLDQAAIFHVIEEKVIRMDSTEVDVEVTATPFTYQGQPAIQVVMRNITKRKLAEKLLDETQKRLSLAVEAANIGVWDWDLRTNEIFFSPLWKSQLGYKPHEIKNNFDEWVSRLHPDDLENSIANLQNFITNSDTHFENVFRLQHKDGSYRWILAQASLIRDKDGEPIQMLGSHIDITGRKQAEEILRESEEKLKNIHPTQP